MIVEYKGKTYRSLGDLANHYGITPEALRQRLHVYKSIDKALEHNKYPANKISITYRGVTYESLLALSNTLGLNHSYLCYKLKKANYDMNKLDEIIATTVKRIVKDHLGNTYNSYTAMCKAWGIPRNVFMYRLDLGHDLEYCLTHPVRKKGLKKIAKYISVS